MINLQEVLDSKNVVAQGVGGGGGGGAESAPSKVPFESRSNNIFLVDYYSFTGF